MAAIKLDLHKTYRAIINAAREPRFISYSELAAANGVPISQARFLLSSHLRELMEYATKREWPVLGSIVVTKPEIDTGTFTESSKNGFVNAARDLGYEIENPEVFIREQQKRVFAWAKNAPDALDIEAMAMPDSSVALFDDPDRCFWFVGADWDGMDMTEQFVRKGVWTNGYQMENEEYAELVQRIKPGDRIAIKSKFKRQKNLPFNNFGKPVPGIKIKAIGTVTERTQDGSTVQVDWHLLAEPKEWYFYVHPWYWVTIAEAKIGEDFTRKLILFAFENHKQDYDFWLRQPKWKEAYSVDPTNNDKSIEVVDSERLKVKSYGVADIINEGCFLSETEISGALERLRESKNLILQGPPGTGKTWLGRRLGYGILGTRDQRVANNRMRFIQFHPSSSYEDFVRGWRPDSSGQLKLINGVFLKAIDEAIKMARDEPFIVLIEEINRGNPAQTFGEMLTLLEKDKRQEEESLELAYPRNAGERIYIPENLYVIGTMNIADRSLALVDLAFRRRFAFVTLAPMLNERWEAWCRQEGQMDSVVVSDIRRLITELNEEIGGDPSLGPQFAIGHSYVTPPKGVTVTDTRLWFRNRVESEIGPLLEEYWYDNPSRAAAATEKLLESN